MKAIHIINILLLVSITIQAQIINIPDVNFKNKLLQPNNARNLQGQVVSIDANQDGEIEVSEAHNIGNMGLSNSNISDLTGLEYFINLRTLSLTNSLITSFDFPTLTQIEILYLGVNPLLASFNASNHPNLKQIFTPETQISELNFDDLSNLISVAAASQPLSSISVKNNPNLNRLYISNTNISTINIQNTNINFNHSGLLSDCWQNTPLAYICCDAEDVPALTTFLTNCGHNLANITIDTTQTCSLSSGAIKSYIIAVYPNPSTGIFNLTLPAVFNGNIELFNTLGQKVYDATFENIQNMVLDLSHLGRGLYVLKVVNADGERFEEKVIIN